MPPPAPLQSTFFCHPESIGSGSGRGIQINYPPILLTFDLDAFGRAIRDTQIIRGDPSQYTRLFEDSNVFIRVVVSQPLEVRTFIAEKGWHDPFFFEYPSQVPSSTYFTHYSHLLDQRTFTCKNCGKKFSCYFYYRVRCSPVSTRSRSYQSRQNGPGSGKGDTDESKGPCEAGPKGGIRRSGRAMIYKIVKSARKYISRGAKWVELKLRGQGESQRR